MSFPSIEQFRHIVSNVRHRAQYRGTDEETGHPIYDRRAPLPSLRAHGTVKLHGTNAGVSLRGGELRCYSRRNLITPDQDNNGFAQFVHDNEPAFRSLFTRFEEPVEIRGEWCGKGIQKGVAICELDKMFVLFSVRSDDGWYDLRDHADLEVPDSRIFNVLRFGSYEVDIDFNDPKAARDEMERLTLEVEAKCPVGAHFGVEGVGEGIVWTVPEYNSSNYWFKTKGKKHRGTSTKRVVEIDPEVAASVQEFVEATVTPQRLEQGITILQEDNKPVAQESTGDFLRWVATDVLKEEEDRLEASGLEKKDVTKAISSKARGWWFSHLNEQAGL